MTLNVGQEVAALQQMTAGQLRERYAELFAETTQARTELNRRGWTTKRWTTKKGTQCGGRLFTKNSLYSLLTNVTYIGKIRYKDEVHNGEHEGIVPDELFQRAQALLQRNRAAFRLRFIRAAFKRSTQNSPTIEGTRHERANDGHP